MKRYNWPCFFFLALALTGCKEDTMRIVTDGGAVPDAVTNINVDNIPGGAVISYKLPQGQDLMYVGAERSEEHKSELQSLMRISYAVFCLKKKKNTSIEKT